LQVHRRTCSALKRVYFRGIHAECAACSGSAGFGEGSTILARAGIGGLTKAVAVETIPAYLRGAVVVVPIRWVAAGPMSGAFPVLDANLELSAVESQTDLVLIGSYRPPLGKLGEAIDRILLKSVARATVRNFLAQLAEVAIAIVAAPNASEPGLSGIELGEP